MVIILEVSKSASPYKSKRRDEFMPDIICDGSCPHQKDGICELEVLSMPFPSSYCAKKHNLRRSAFKKPDILL